MMKNAYLMTLAGLMVLLTSCRNMEPQFAETLPNPAPPTTAPQTVTFTNEFDNRWLEPPTQMFTLGPGDRLEIELIGDPSSKATTVIAPDGKLYYNLLPGLDVWGRTLGQTKADLENTFTNYHHEQPRVSLVLRAVESKRVWVLGCVQVPGIYRMATPTTLLEVISSAGGTLSLTSFRDQAAAGIGEELADLKHSFVVRHGKLLPINFSRLLNEGDLSQNIYLQPDDFVYVPPGTARDVYVLGAVTQPRPVPYTEGMTVAAAIANSYGTLKDAYLAHVAVVRGSLSEPEITIVDYRKVIRGEATDIVLQPHDIVYVPLSPYRYLRRYAELILNTFVASAAINAGSSAVLDPGAAPVGGVFIPVGSGIQIFPPVSPPPP